MAERGPRAYTGGMAQTSAEILKTARALPRDERAQLVRELLATLGEHDVPESVRLDALRSAVDRGVADLDAGRGIDVPPGDLRKYLRERGRLATDRAGTTTA